METGKKTAQEILAMDSEKLAEAIRNRSVQDVALGILQLAMECRDVLHVFVWYVAHVRSLDIQVYSKDTIYVEGMGKVRLLEETFNFKRDDIKDLLAIEDKLIELVAEARDKAEVVA
ncbi:hypothetical protein [Photobacterium sp. 53610]|uniref:hypothetical protein n=1 Tax=Photobacterium sp. 53610 TaxID=3102789 RepID=UPI002EDB1025